MNPINPRDFKRPEAGIRISRPNESMEDDNDIQTPSRSDRSAGEESVSLREKKSGKGAWILVLAIVVALAALGFIFRDRLFGSGASAGNSEFQAVFLTNGQVYFGKLSHMSDSYAELENIYYLQVTPVLQTKTEGQAGSQANSQQEQQLSLVKLGNELHAPVDRMKVNRDQILFVEDLKSDGRVVQAIKDYENTQSKK